VPSFRRIHRPRLFLSPRRKAEAESAPIETVRSRLFASIDARVRLHPGQSGVVELRDARDAFAARAHLADAAEYTLDIQYYIWRNDMSGMLLFEAIHRAADRGVRVRLLIDDNNTNRELDEILGALDAHPNIEVRLFNPFLMRRFRTLNIYDFSRLNRRMHNKSFTADHLVTIVGGRNIGDEYFDAHNEIAFVDLDVMAIGPVVDQVTKDFERYWRSESAYPLKSILRRPTRATAAEITKAAQAVTQEPAARAYVRALENSRFVQDLIAGTLHYHWSAVRILSDDPSKVLGRAAPHEMISERLLGALGQPTRELQIISAYFVPTRAGTEMLADLARSGVKITVLTNALEATDVAVVHAGYAKRRKQLLKAGIEIYELKRMSELTSGRDRKLTGNSGSSLHAKTFVVDRERLFVGSFNFDPRSARLNTELGFLIESPAMATEVAKTFESEIPATSYQVRLARHGLLQWVERRGKETIVHKREPGATPLKRLMLYLMSKLPIEWLL
jgi:putative cardiolipin synthase